MNHLFPKAQISAYAWKYRTAFLLSHNGLLHSMCWSILDILRCRVPGLLAVPLVVWSACRSETYAVKFVAAEASCNSSQLAAGTVEVVGLAPAESQPTTSIAFTAKIAESGNFTVCYATHGIVAAALVRGTGLEMRGLWAGAVGQEIGRRCTHNGMHQ